VTTVDVHFAYDIRYLSGGKLPSIIPLEDQSLGVGASEFAAKLCFTNTPKDSKYIVWVALQTSPKGIIFRGCGKESIQCRTIRT
jgi:hypothetical protein